MTGTLRSGWLLHKTSRGELLIPLSLRGLRTGNVELVGQIAFALVVRIYQKMQAVYRHCCHLSGRAEESRRSATPTSKTMHQIALVQFSEMRRISQNRIFDIIVLLHSVSQSISSSRYHISYSHETGKR